MNSDLPNHQPNNENINDENTNNNDNLNLPQYSHSTIDRKSYLFRQGQAINESNFEFTLFQKYLRLGVTRSLNMLHSFVCSDITVNSLDAKPFDISHSTDSAGTVPQGPRVTLQRLRKISELNNWGERAADYDNDNYTLELLEAEKTREIEHKRKLEMYRAKQEFLGQLASRNAAMLLKLISNKVENILEQGEELSIDQLKPLGDLAARLAETGKNISSESLGVNELLELLEGDDE